MGKTIRQLAEELGVTKPTIAKAIRELDIDPQKVGNRNELSDGQCEQIKLQISKKNANFRFANIANRNEKNANRNRKNDNIFA